MPGARGEAAERRYWRRPCGPLIHARVGSVRWGQGGGTQRLGWGSEERVFGCYTRRRGYSTSSLSYLIFLRLGQPTVEEPPANPAEALGPFKENNGWGEQDTHERGAR